MVSFFFLKCRYIDGSKTGPLRACYNGPVTGPFGPVTGPSTFTCVQDKKDSNIIFFSDMADVFPEWEFSLRWKCFFTKEHTWQQKNQKMCWENYVLSACHVWSFVFFYIWLSIEQSKPNDSNIPKVSYWFKIHWRKTCQI